MKIASLCKNGENTLRCNPYTLYVLTVAILIKDHKCKVDLGLQVAAKTFPFHLVCLIFLISREVGTIIRSLGCCPSEAEILDMLAEVSTICIYDILELLYSLDHPCNMINVRCKLLDAVCHLKIGNVINGKC